jgi:diguanylate cyclase (GGDEF)-like protein
VETEESPAASGARRRWLAIGAGLCLLSAIGLIGAIGLFGRAEGLEQVALGALIVCAFASIAISVALARRVIADEALAARRTSLEQSAKRAVSLSRFAELVQNSRDAAEIRTATATMLESALDGGEVQLAEWAESHDRFTSTWPAREPDGADGAEQIPLDKCPVAKRQRLVRAEVGQPQTCKCAFGVPASGAYACVPMRAAGELIGIANVRTQRKGWSHNDVMLAQSYVGFAASSIESLRVLASIHDRAVKDGLTGAYNRRFLDEYLVHRLAEAVRHGQPLSLALMDLDHFKKLNDSSGHATGDRALVELAGVVNRTIRAGDVLVRYGGEEFVLVLGATDLAGAMIVADRIRASTEEVRIAVPGREEPARVTVSIGLASAPEHGGTASELLLVADRALYRAKDGGRNRVEPGERLPDDVSAEVSRSSQS